jgi:hypothetical protein
MRIINMINTIKPGESGGNPLLLELAAGGTMKPVVLEDTALEDEDKLESV